VKRALVALAFVASGVLLCAVSGLPSYFALTTGIVFGMLGAWMPRAK